jgi:hypothetical protein
MCLKSTLYIFITGNNYGVISVVAAHLSVKQVARVRFPVPPQKCLINFQQGK